MADYNLRSVHVSCLYYLYSTEALVATDLCERCEEDKATISRALDYLEKNGFLVCDAKHAKRYNSPLYLTEKGKEAGARIADKIENVLKGIDRDLTEEERVAFYRSLNIVCHALEEIANPSDATALTHLPTKNQEPKEVNL